ncbi:MAG: hypothetical protein GXO11_00075 [Epsilonproteobacteria bacterium]|nr:hypothetical protein [Campylobacterota bacterium]
MKQFYIYFLAIIFFTSLNASNTLHVKEAVNIAAYSYFEPKKFYKLEKKPQNKIYTAVLNGVQSYLIDNKEKTILVFRGTVSDENVKTDLSYLPTQFLDVNGSSVHSGFYDVAQKSLQTYKSFLKKNKPVFVIGHSLGGGVAILTGALLYKKGYDVTVYTFGSPAVGNKAFIDSIKGLKHYRYLHEKDLIAKIDESNIGFLNKILIFAKKEIAHTFPDQDIATYLQQLISSVEFHYIHDNYKTILIKKSIPATFAPTNSYLLNYLLSPARYHNISTYQRCLQ